MAAETVRQAEVMRQLLTKRVGQPAREGDLGAHPPAERRDNAAGRKNRTAEAIKAREAMTFRGAAAVAAGLPDELGTFEGVLADLACDRTTLSARPREQPQ